VGHLLRTHEAAIEVGAFLLLQLTLDRGEAPLGDFFFDLKVKIGSAIGGAGITLKLLQLGEELAMVADHLLGEFLHLFALSAVLAPLRQLDFPFVVVDQASDDVLVQIGGLNSGTFGLDAWAFGLHAWAFGLYAGALSWNAGSFGLYARSFDLTFSDRGAFLGHQERRGQNDQR
jgi:hypothetical protein